MKVKEPKAPAVTGEVIGLDINICPNCVAKCAGC